MQHKLLLACALAALPFPFPQTPPAAPAQAGGGQAEQVLPHYPPGVPKVLCDIDRVIDGDTIWVQYHGKQTKLRLLCVDTEEKLSVDTGSASKPGTVFGEECAKWAQDFFAASTVGEKRAQVGLYFPAGREQLDAYGRLLCHVILPDGRDFNLLLVEEGKSPYFNKYGNSPVAHELFVEAQNRAREKKKGIWDPATNVPKTVGAPSARRPYEKLVPWWNARAAAIDDFRERERKEPAAVADAENPASLKAALARGGEVDVFGTIDRLFDESNGDWTLLMRCEDKHGALRVRIAKDKRALFSKLDFEHLNDDYRQNYFWIRGKMKQGSRGVEIEANDPAQLRIAKPEPVDMTKVPVPATAGGK
ncbi:MAG TPA: thermonuclease family protein [Planctomycetota bacterium]|nr:thermonuclease family protein [Planctomycetota bacterium]